MTGLCGLNDMKVSFVWLPNALTLCALSGGLCSIAGSMGGATRLAALAILAASLFDALDGWAARLTGSASRLGRRLDSVSDFFSFCVAPAVLLHGAELRAVGWIGGVSVLAYTLCGAARLIRYHAQADSLEREGFTGVPTTGAAIAVASASLCLRGSSPQPAHGSAWVFLTLVLSLLMISTVRYRSAKSAFPGRQPQAFALVPVAGVLFLALGVWAPAVLLAGSAAYLLSGPAAGIWRRTRPADVLDERRLPNEDAM